MTTVLVSGRKLPHQDWEGDDWVPGSGGEYVSCTDTATGRSLCWASNGRLNYDGKQIRAAVHPHDPDGITLPQAKQAVESLTTTTLVIPDDWQWYEVLHALREKIGLVVQLWYAKIQREDRFQLRADFGHAEFIPYYSPTAGMLVYDPLDPNVKHHGSWGRARDIRAGMEELASREGSKSLYCAYVPLQHL